MNGDFPGRDINEQKILVAKKRAILYGGCGQHQITRGGELMGKDKDVKKDTKKKPAKTLKEKKEAKRLKKTGKAGEV
ncbi:MAG: hypothetical protein CO013_02470 [Syntrophobacterales bacterium CG_4_8_14_3_um_filter_58_8]|nr:MAG: hypothetical protein AUK26_01070 [Syntrophaceae bacterium CG2_30_58_14]PIV03976.1 MAG: hypothetical protein COS57_09920 [Syntrophobacterales bacterium CG03_land_8_20_14_0_80_58_14]PJC75234.1 MAG: hypothetical protein CO013_02470 [Syntrophobacterales bacterium CG_4_8_14_3_um_filter_58_8]